MDSRLRGNDIGGCGNDVVGCGNHIGICLNEQGLWMSDIFAYICRDQDLRSERAQEYELLLLRLELLEPEDKNLVELYLEHNVNFKQLGLLCGVHRVTICRRILRLCKRLLEDEYITILRNREQFEPVELAVAYDRFLLGMGARRIASKRQLGYRPTKRIVERLEKVVSQGAGTKIKNQK